jgi:hypothetical protein
MLLRTLFLLALVFGLSGAARAQQQPEQVRPAQPAKVSKDPVEQDKGQNRPEPKIIVGSPEAEMMARQELKAAEKDYKDNLERAREASQLSTEIRDTFLHNKALGRTEEKKLERLEKLTRKIRSEAGGSDGEGTLEDVPMQMEPALARLTEVTDKMRKVVEKTPRQVVSAAVIDRANELLEIIRYIRTFTRQESRVIK